MALFFLSLYISWFLTPFLSPSHDLSLFLSLHLWRSPALFPVLTHPLDLSLSFLISGLTTICHLFSLAMAMCCQTILFPALELVNQPPPPKAAMTCKLLLLEFVICCHQPPPTTMPLTRKLVRFYLESVDFGQFCAKLRCSIGEPIVSSN